MLFYHVAYHARAVESLKKVLVSLVLRLVPVKVSFHKDVQRKNLGIGSMGIVAKQHLDPEHNIDLAWWGAFPAGDHYRMLLYSKGLIGEKFCSEMR
jgi:hypothetical protein